MKGNNYSFERENLCDCLHDYSLENQISIDKHWYEVKALYG